MVVDHLYPIHNVGSLLIENLDALDKLYRR